MASTPLCAGRTTLTTTTAEIYTSGHHAEDVVAEFLKDYAEARPATITELVNMVIKSAGCDLQVTEDDINDIDNVEGKLGELQEDFQAVISITSRESTLTDQISAKHYRLSLDL